MMKKISKKAYLWSILLIICVICLSLWGWHIHNANSKYVRQTTPTFFFHGSGSSYHAEEYMVNGAKKAGVTKTVVVANVDKNGKVTFKGQIKAGAKNPIIEVNHQVNPGKPSKGKEPQGKPSDHSKIPIDASYVAQVIMAAKQKWHFQTMNIVAHSAGNVDVLYMLKEHAHDSKLPKLKKQVAIAAHVNGFRGGGYPSGAKVANNGKPSQENANFKDLVSLRKTYPQGAKVLNIYGNIEDGTHSDGLVPVNSARTLKYLVGKRASSYQEKEIKGQNARHSKLHHNPDVNRLLINFLWAK